MLLEATQRNAIDFLTSRGKETTLYPLFKFVEELG